MQFVSVDHLGKYSLDTKALEVLRKIETPLTIISVIGRYRTGKSSLLNGLTGHATFATSSTVQAQTKGILVHMLNETTLLMDTEGLGSLDVSRDHDAAIFALAMLVSSGCFFNNLGSITSQSIDDLHLATKVAGLLCRHAKFSKQLPSLVWIMRDFTLDLCDRNNLPISADTYFEQCVDRCDPIKGQDLRTLFPSRRCIPLARPTAEDRDLKEMRNLRPEFTEGIENIRNLMRQFPPKTVGDSNKPMTGHQLCTLVEALCLALNSDAVPDLDDVWQHISRQSRQRAASVAQEAFTGAASTLDGLDAAYTVYTDTSLEDTVSGPDTFALVQTLLRGDTRGQEFEQRYVETKRDFDVYVATTQAQEEDAQSRIREGESNLASAHRKIARLVDEGLTTQYRLAELELLTVPPVQESTELLGVLDGLQTKHKQLKSELAEKQRLLDDAIQTIHVQDRTIADNTHRLAAERKTTEDQRVRAHSLETHLTDLKSDLQQAKTDVAIWRSRMEDLTSRSEKKRKTTDDTYTELISLTSEVNFLRNRHDEDTKRLQTILQDSATLAQQVQSLQVKLALEIGK
jgi:predicted  nucleic acid-binding Zn-ribbon protein